MGTNKQSILHNDFISPEQNFAREIISFYPNCLFKYMSGASLVAQWLRVCLPMQGTRVRALVWEDPTCRGATGPVSHNY